MRLIENSRLLDCHFRNGMMMLPYYHSIIEAKINDQTFAGEGVKKAPIKRRFLSLLSGLKHCTIKRKDILIFSSTLFNVKKNNRYFNCLHGYYYNLYPQGTLLIEDSDNSYVWRTNNSCENLSFINTYYKILCLILRKICHTFAPIHCSDYNVFIKEYPSLFTADKLSKDDYYTKFYAFFIRKLLRRVDPKIIIVNCASYGHVNAIVCYVAKKMGIKVIEPQHGVTYKCTGYVTSDIVAESKEYYNYLPDTLFTFGDYWKSFVNWKYEKKSVGYQYLNEYASSVNEIEITHEFLVISQPMNEEEEKAKINFVKDIARLYPNKRILFRIHPSENYNQQKDIYSDFENIDISNSTKVLYEDFNRSRYVIGWFSNCLYECLAFKRVPIIVETEYTKEYFPHNIGIWVKTAEDLKMIDLETQQRTIDYTKYWTKDFDENVKRFLSNIL